MAKKILSNDGVVEVMTDAQKLAEIRGNVLKVEVPVIPAEAPVVPAIPSVTPQDILAALKANPELASEIAKLVAPAAPVTKRVYSAGVANAAATCRKSAQRDGFVEFTFDQKPDESTRAQLKSAGYRWSKFNKVWYGPAATLTNHDRFGALVQGALQS